MKKILCLTLLILSFSLSVHAQTTNYEDIDFNNLKILSYGWNFDISKPDKFWPVADLSINDIADKEVVLFRYEVVNKFGEETISSEPSDPSPRPILRYNTNSHELITDNYSILFKESTKLCENNLSINIIDKILIVPSTLPRNEEITVIFYNRDGSPNGRQYKLKYDNNGRIICRAIGNKSINIKYTADGHIIGFSNVESFNPKQYVKQLHTKSEYQWKGNDLQLITIQYIEQQSNMQGILKPLYEIQCEILEKDEVGRWIKMKVIEKDCKGGRPDKKYVLERIIREITLTEQE